MLASRSTSVSSVLLLVFNALLKAQAVVCQAFQCKSAFAAGPVAVTSRLSMLSILQVGTRWYKQDTTAAQSCPCHVVPMFARKCAADSVQRVKKSSILKIPKPSMSICRKNICASPTTRRLQVATCIVDNKATMVGELRDVCSAGHMPCLLGLAHRIADGALVQGEAVSWQQRVCSGAALSGVACRTSGVVTGIAARTLPAELWGCGLLRYLMCPQSHSQHFLECRELMSMVTFCAVNCMS